MKKWDNLLSTSFLIKRLNNPYILRGDGDTYAVAVVPHVVGVDKDVFVPVRKHGQVVMVPFVEDEFHFTRQTAVLFVVFEVNAESYSRIPYTSTSALSEPMTIVPL